MFILCFNDFYTVIFWLQFSWYARRIALAGVYKASELYLIQDNSPEHKETWTFLNRRLTEAIQLHDMLLKSDLASQGAKDTVAAAFITVSGAIILVVFDGCLFNFPGEEYFGIKLE